MYRGGKFFAIHTDHLRTPRLMTHDSNTPVWQWPYSAFGTTKPTGVLVATPNPMAAITNQPVLLKATGATELNLRFPGQYFDAEMGTFYNMQRDAHLPSIFRVGYSLARGKGVNPDLQQAYPMLITAAVRGHAYALREMALQDLRGGRGLLWMPIGICEFVLALCWGVVVSMYNKDSDLLRG